MSFRNVKNQRDYLKNKNSSPSWMYMSRLSATKEFAFMKVLYENGFSVPKPIDHNRHCIVMSYIDATPLRQVEKVGDVGKLYSDLMDLIVKLANYGLIHGDFNEFNILITLDQQPILIDFPQMVSINHKDAEYYFNRDVDCIRTFFKKKFRYESTLYPKFSLDVNREFSLDLQVAATGFPTKLQRELEEYTAAISKHEANSDDDFENDSENEDDDNDEQSEGEGEGGDADKSSLSENFSSDDSEDDSTNKKK
ncbi:Serine/threonine-protein kinase RIO2 [Smittium culicis]|uniref:non-specific serine/threonine protein kinase n=1 Tax=Smittium culicis TaxID=133412 RepID=A0A1R1XUB2_9FUNG|nr:Serine/threonine-protein kinase RIO2 [Smittium culicis]